MEKTTVLKDNGPILTKQRWKKKKSDFLITLHKSESKFKRIERETVEQSDSNEWLEIRRNLLTASNFGRVCNMRATTGCETIVKQLLYTVFGCEAMAYGSKNEEVAWYDLENVLGQKIRPFHRPDGLLNEDGTVEIKSPSSAKDMAPDEAFTKA